MSSKGQGKRPAAERQSRGHAHNHIQRLLNYLTHRMTNAVTEGFNSKIQMIKSCARNFRSFENYQVAMLFHCGKLQLHPL